MTLRRARRAAIVWGLFLLALTSWPSPPQLPSEWTFADMDKVVHALLYGMEGFLLYFAVAWRGPFGAWRRALVIGGILAVWGTLDEIHQAFIPGRSMEGLDALTDMTAGFFGALVAARLSISPRWSRIFLPADSRASGPSPTANGS
jgi:VanZ family protein